MAASSLVDTYHPFDAGPGSSIVESQWRAMAQHWRGSGVIRDAENGCAVTTSSGNVRVQTGQCWIKGAYGAITGNKDMAPAAAHPTLPRIDRCVLRADFANNDIRVALIDGTAASDPTTTIPALTQTSTVWETRLAQVHVAQSSGTLTITDEREYSRGVGEMPVGAVLHGSWTALPAGGFIAAIGQAVSRVTYWELFAQSGVLHGVGNGSTTFNVADGRGRVSAAPDSFFSSGDAGRLDLSNTIGTTAGTQYHTLTEAEMPSHAHAGAAGFSVVVGSLLTSTLSLNTSADIDHGGADVTYSTTNDAGSDAPHNNMQPTLLIPAIVKI